MSIKKPVVSIEAIVVLRSCICLRELLEFFLKASVKLRNLGIVSAFLGDMSGSTVTRKRLADPCSQLTLRPHLASRT